MSIAAWDDWKCKVAFFLDKFKWKSTIEREVLGSLRLALWYNFIWFELSQLPRPCACHIVTDVLKSANCFRSLELSPLLSIVLIGCCTVCRTSQEYVPDMTSLKAVPNDYFNDCLGLTMWWRLCCWTFDGPGLLVPKSLSAPSSSSSSCSLALPSCPVLASQSVTPSIPHFSIFFSLQGFPIFPNIVFFLHVLRSKPQKRLYEEVFTP